MNLRCRRLWVEVNRVFQRPSPAARIDTRLPLQRWLARRLSSAPHRSPTSFWAGPAIVARSILGSFALIPLLLAPPRILLVERSCCGVEVFEWGEEPCAVYILVLDVIVLDALLQSLVILTGKGMWPETLFKSRWTNAPTQIEYCCPILRPETPAALPSMASKYRSSRTLPSMALKYCSSRM